MNCDHCGLKLRLDRDHVEWLATATGTCLQHTIRKTHKKCQYYDTELTFMEARNLFDRWLPLMGLRNHIPLAMDMDWDNRFLAHDKLRKTITQTRGTYG